MDPIDNEPMRLVLVLVLMLALVGCATSYESATRHESIGPRAYLVTGDGNGFTSRSEITAYTYRRANELCPMGFDVIDADRSTVPSHLRRRQDIHHGQQA
jgi:hypothetical protein